MRTKLHFVCGFTRASIRGTKPGILSIILPISLISTVLMEIVTLTIQEIGLYLNYGTFRWLFIIFSVVWLSCSPLRKSCCDGRCTEVLFNLVPIEVLYMLLFAQWHFKAFLAILILILVAEIAFAVSHLVTTWLNTILRDNAVSSAGSTTR